jgi:hypothetical protein
MDSTLYLLHRAAIVTTAASLIAAADVVLGVALFGLLKRVRVSIHGATWVLGALLLGASVILCLDSVLHTNTVDDFDWSNLLGTLSFLIAVHAAGLWSTRRWYVLVKAGISRTLALLTRPILLYLRRHHTFLGWVVLLTATGHSLYFLLNLPRLGTYRVITGLIDWVILGTVIGGGLLITWGKTHKQRTGRARRTHIALTVLFLLAFVLHIT